MKTVAERIKNLIDQKKDFINKNDYFTLIIKIQDGYPVIMKQEISLKPTLKNDK